MLSHRTLPFALGCLLALPAARHEHAAGTGLTPDDRAFGRVLGVGPPAAPQAKAGAK